MAAREASLSPITTRSPSFPYHSSLSSSSSWSSSSSSSSLFATSSWSSSSSSSLYDQATAASTTLTTTTTTTRMMGIEPVVHQQEPLLYQIPNDLVPIYRDLPLRIRGGMLLSTVLLVLVMSCSSQKKLVFALQRLWLTPIRFFLQMASSSTSATAIQWRKLLFDLVRGGIVYLGLTTLIQDLYYAPSRISVQDLQAQYHLPSPLSRYETIVVNTTTTSPGEATREGSSAEQQQQKRIGVHWLQYDNPQRPQSSPPPPPLPLGDDKSQDQEQQQSQQQTPRHRFDVLYLHHGFGASSLSWMPCMVPLTERLDCRTAIASDTMGFGFTERTDEVKDYTSEFNSQVGMQLLRNELGKQQQQQERQQSNSSNDSTTIPDDDGGGGRILLMGHSMGSLSTLRMALQLKDSKRKVHVVLAAPALGFGMDRAPYMHPHRRRRRRQSSSDTITTSTTNPTFQSMIQGTFQTLQRMVVDRPASYALRRLVGTRNFWRRCLRSVWGNPLLVSEADVLRFQWPSVGQGWEQGLLRFTRGQTTLTRDVTDRALLQRVLDQPHVQSVHVILGSKDPVVRTTHIRNFLKDFPDVHIVELDGLGHDPFEENVEAYVETVQGLQQLDE